MMHPQSTHDTLADTEMTNRGAAHYLFPTLERKAPRAEGRPRIHNPDRVGRPPVVKFDKHCEVGLAELMSAWPLGCHSPNKPKPSIVHVDPDGHGFREKK
jgi:hypothetical protein